MSKDINYPSTKKVIEKINGLSFGTSHKWSEDDVVFFTDRYTKILLLLPDIKKEDIGLEIGLCGGIMAFLLKNYYSLDKLNTLEHPVPSKMYSKAFLRKLKDENIILKSCDLHQNKLPWPNQSLDFVIFSELMEHLIPAKLENIYKEIWRVLKNDGWLLVTTPNTASLIKRIKLLLGGNPIEFDLSLHESATYGHIREYTMEELLKILQNHGFTILNNKYFMIDSKRNIYTQIENVSAKIIPSFANNLGVLAKKVK